MQIAGERFELPLDESDDESRPAPPTVSPFDLVGEIKERNADLTTSAPAPPRQKNGTAGFPTHRKRAVMSRFKARKQEAAPAAAEPAPPPVLSEKQQIDRENRDTLAHMTQAEIQGMQQDLMASLNPKTLQKLLARSYIDQPEQSTDFPGLEKPKSGMAKTSADVEEVGDKDTTKPQTHKKVAFAADQPGDSAPAATVEDKPEVPTNKNPDSLPHAPDSDTSAPDRPSIHWPKPNQPPSLDPAAPSFLDDLHSKYFPDVPSEPEKLEWMKSTSESTYKRDATGLDPKDIRFSFSGALIPPTLAAEIPVTAGLHHHGDAPDAAGYTIAELGILARSTVAAQRCMAFQTLGRILFRLGKGEFGNSSEERPDVERAEQMGELARGLWDEVQKHAVVDICVNESEGRGPGMGRHASAKAYATEAVWLWQKGGGRRWTAA